MERPRHPGLPEPREQPAVRKHPSAASLLAAGPWMPTAYEIADAAAVQAVAKGEADSLQQRRAYTWIVQMLCATYDLSYRPGNEAGARDTTFAEGKRYVGLQLVKMANANIGLLRRSEEHGDPHEPKS